MALSIVNQWTSSSGDRDQEISITPTDGNWIFAAVSLHKIDARPSEFSVGDLCRNLWHRVGHAENLDNGLITEIWACPNVKTYGAGTRVYVAVSFLVAYDIGSCPVTVFEVSGMGNGYLTTGPVTTAIANGTTNLTVPAPVVPADSLILSSVVLDVNFGNVATTGTGWTALTPKIDVNPNTGIAPSWAQGTSANNINVALLAGTGHWAGLSVAILKSGTPPSVTADWGNSVSIETQLALGYDQSTPTSSMKWRTLSDRCQHIHTTRGIQAELGTTQAGDTTIGWLNDEGSLTPRDGGTAVVVSSGTASTVKISDGDADSFELGDFFRLQTYAGALKEDTVFRVSGKSSTAGVTTLTFDPDAAASPVVGNVVSGTPLDIFTPVRVLATVDGKKYPVLVGSSESVPQTWVDDEHGRVEMSAVDGYGTLTATVPNVVTGQMQSSRPYALWPLSDASGSQSAINASSRSSAVLNMATSKFGAGNDGTADFGISLQDTPQDHVSPLGNTSLTGGGSLTGWGQSGLTGSADTTKGKALVGYDDNMPSIANGVTICGISLVEQTQATGDATICIIRNNDPSTGNGEGSIIKLCKQSGTNYAKIVWWSPTGYARTDAVSTIQIANAGYVLWTLQLTEWSYTLTINNRTFSSACHIFTNWNQIDVGGEADQFWNGHCTNGVHSHIAVYDRLITPGETDLLYKAVQTGMSAYTTTDGTIQRQLCYSGWSGSRILTSSDIKTSEDVGLDGSSVGDAVSGISTWEDGLLSVDSAGYLRFLSRDLLDRTTKKFTLGPDTGAGEIPYLGAPTYDADGRLLFTEFDVDNTAHVGHFLATDIADKSGTISAFHENAGKYGLRPRTVSTHLFNIGDAYALSEWLVNRYGVRQLRIRQVQVDPRASSGTTGWHAVLGAEIGDEIGVRWNPTGSREISTTCNIIGISHDADPSRWITTFTLMVAPDQGIVLNSSTAGVIGEGVLTL